MNQLLIDALSPVVAAVASTMVSIVAALAYDRFRRWTGMEIEARHREALQSALANAANIMVSGASLKEGIAYVQASVPDALKALKVSHSDHIEALLEPHVAAWGKGRKAAASGG